MSSRTVITLPLVPPSVNAIWRGARGRVYKSPVYKKWVKDVGLIANRQAAEQPKWSVPVDVTIYMRRPRTNSDLDNRIKCCLDLLQSIGVLADDKLVHGITALWREEVEGVVIVITALSQSEAA